MMRTARSTSARRTRTAVLATRTAILATAVATALTSGAGAVSDNTISTVPAKQLFGTRTLPADLPAASHGFYSKGCLAGGEAVAVDGPNWQAMRLSRNRRWGHPKTIEVVERLSRDVAAKGRNGILVGDISQPRGGPMLTGHASHQIGLDADIWLRDMPGERFTIEQRESESAISVLKDGTRTLNEKVWTQGHYDLIRTAAGYKEVQRVLVHPAIKQKLCQTAGNDRAWLSKVRPYYGHHYHMHVRLHCQPGSPGCRPQKAVTPGDGCGDNLAWWLSDAPWGPAPKKVAKAKTKKISPKLSSKPNVPKFKMMADLPQQCRGVLAAGAPESEAVATRGGAGKAYATATAKAWLAKAAERTADEPGLDDVGLPRTAPAPKTKPFVSAPASLAPTGG